MQTSASTKKLARAKKLCENTEPETRKTAYWLFLLPG